jgi:hypothetical protein
MSLIHQLARPRGRKRGQTLVIFALMAVVLFGFAGLALDAGHIYLVYRLTQNATDAAALAGGKRLGAAMRYAPLASSSDASGAPQAIHDYAQANGYTTTFNTSCDSAVAGSFTTSWVDKGTCAGGFTTRITITSPPPTLTPDCSNVPYNCLQITITRTVQNFLMGVLGIPSSTITTSATVLALPPGNVATMPASYALYLYAPDVNPAGPCIGPPGQCKKLATVPQWFDPTIPPSRSQLSCAQSTASCPTFWSRTGSSPMIAGIDGHNIPDGDLAAMQSNGSVVLQDPTTFCDPYGGTCAAGSPIGLKGFSLKSGSKLYCSSSNPSPASPIACTTTGLGSAPLSTETGSETSFVAMTWAPTITAPQNVCGSLVLDGDTVANSGGSGSCNPPATDPYLILPGVYGSIVINHGIYEFGPGVFQITGTAPQNSKPAGQLANGIDHSQEGTASAGADWDLCPSGLSPCVATAGIWITHGSAPFVAGSSGSGAGCSSDDSGGGSPPPNAGGGDATWVKGSGVTFQFTGSSGGFVSTNEVSSVSLSAPGLGTQPATGGVPILFDMENNSFIHMDAANPSGGGGGDDGEGSSSVLNQFVGIIYQTSSATAGGVEINAGLGGTGSAIRGQVLAYSFTTFGIPGTAVSFTSGFGVGSGPPPTSTGGRNETEIYAAPAATLTAAVQPGFETLTWHYTDEWKLDAFTTYVKINNTTPVYFSQGIWSPTPGPGVPLPPSGNNPGEGFAAYPSLAQDLGNKYTHTSTSNNSSDWTMKYADGSSMEINGGWVWGHENAIGSGGGSGGGGGSDTDTLKYIFPIPAGLQSTITLFMSDGDRCGDWVTVTVTLNNVGTFNPGLQSAPTVSLEQ